MRKIHKLTGSQERLNILSQQKVFKEIKCKDSFSIGTMVLNWLLSNYWKLHNLSNGIDIYYLAYCVVIYLDLKLSTRLYNQV